MCCWQNLATGGQPVAFHLQAKQSRLLSEAVVKDVIEPMLKLGQGCGQGCDQACDQSSDQG